MKKPANLPTVVVIVTICSIFLWLPLFMNYYVLMEADFLKNCQTYEDLDFDTFLAGQKSQPLLWAPNLALTHGVENLIKSSNSFYFHLAFLGQNTIKLRC